MIKPMEKWISYHIRRILPSQKSLLWAGPIEKVEQSGVNDGLSGADVVGSSLEVAPFYAQSFCWLPIKKETY